MRGLIILGLILVVASAINAIVIGVVRRMWSRQPARPVDEEAARMGRHVRLPAKSLVFTFLVWLSTWVAVVGLVVAWTMWVEADSAPAPETRVDADRVRAMHRANAGLLLAVAVIGFGLGVAGCCGIRSGDRIVLTLTGCVLGFVLNLALGAVAIGLYAYFGVERFRGPYV
jgi:hypothetical protein